MDSGMPRGITAPSMTSVSSGMMSSRTRSGELSKAMSWDKVMSDRTASRDVRQGVPQLGEAGPQEAGHLHLAHADEVGDLGLGEATHVAQLDDASLTGGQLGQQALDGGRGVDRVEGAVGAAERGEVVDLAVIAGGGQRRLAVAAGRFQRVEHFLDRNPGMAGDLVHSG